ncbi:MAG: ABC transporter ATP-binding protein [Syntrophobacteraceae bacterium]|nr:ABC transporter ATP-binding protein [Syntrophobacteraceae bacterium]
MSPIVRPWREALLTDTWICLKSVSFVRNRRPILQDIDWTVERGTHWVILGPNGSGKTTLLQLLAGYLWPTRGEIILLGERFGNTDLRELRKKIGWVGSFLEAHIPPAQKPLDLIISGKTASIGIFDKPTREDYEKAGHIARQMGCEGILDSPYGVLSQGEKQRLLIGRALIHDPQLLVLDEPCAGLDIVARERLLQTLESLAAGPKPPTMVLVTHHVEEITPSVSHAFLMIGGRCVAQGKKRDVLRSACMSEAFGIGIEVVGGNGRFFLKLTPSASLTRAKGTV